MSSRQRLNKRLHSLIHDVLINEWDPIGVGHKLQAQDEYDSYIPELLRLLTSDAGAVKLADHLHQLETVSIGLRGDRERTARIAERLRQVYLDAISRR